MQWQHEGQFGLHSLAAWEIATGAGVRIAIIDNGMEITHDDLRDGIVGGGYFEHRPPGAATATFFRFQPGMTDFPDSGHGTACMGMAGARQNNRIEGSGIAPNSDLLAIACALDQTGNQETLARAIGYAINPQQVDPDDPTPGADVISCSLDTAHHVETVLELAINSAASGRNWKGVPIFWAVNNVREPLNQDRLCSLANVIAVGRSGEGGGVAIQCAYGPKLEFLAPGLHVLGPLWGSNDEWSGTSFATPLAAGVAALVLERHPTWTAAQVLQRLRDTCDMPAGHATPNDRYGHGRINAYRAVHDPV
jgi:thermitase